MLCHRGCGLESTFINYLGEPCCSPRAPSCPVIKKKIGEKSGATRKGKSYDELHGENADTMRKKRSAHLTGRQVSDTTREKIKQSNKEHWKKTPRTPWNKGKTGVQVPWNKGKRKREPMKIIDSTDEIYNDFRKYRNRVSSRTRKNYQLFKEEINPNNLLIGKCGIDGAHQVDHIISVREGFEKRIPVEVIAAKDNLQILPWLDNIKKYDGSRKNK